MKKAGLITYHNNRNYGAALQCYALQRAVSDMGVDCRVINYIPPVEKRENRLFDFSLSASAAIRNIRTLLSLSKRIRRKRAFEDFNSRCFRLTADAYRLPEQITQENLGMDMYITGSDQTFNLLISGDKEFRRAFFLPRITDAPKFAFAASMGENIGALSEDDALWIKERLKTYRAVSVREERTAQFIERLGLKKPPVLIDPSALFTAEEWNALCCSTGYESEEYILFYSVLSAPWVIRRVNAIARRTGLKVVAPHLKNRYELGCGFIRAEECGPGGFLSLVKNARLILTTSLHGTIFSLLYNKPFVAFVLGEGNRLQDIAGKAGVLSRLLREEDAIPETDELLRMDFDGVNSALARERAHALSFLKNALTVCAGEL